MSADNKAMLVEVFRKIKTVSKWAGLVVGVALVALVIFVFDQARKESEHQRKIQEWNWNHYTGWRISRLYDTPEYIQRGIWTDNKTDKQCTDKGYPSYPACVPQEYVVNGIPGVPAGVTLDFSKSVPTIDYAALAQQAGGVPVAPATAPKPKHAKPKTGTVKYQSVLDVDACGHESSTTIPAGSKVKILGRVGIEWVDGCVSHDAVKVSFDGVIGWVMASFVQEDIVAPVEAPSVPEEAVQRPLGAK